MSATIDSNCAFGPATVPVRAPAFTLGRLRTLMQEAEIDKAVVHHTLAKEHDPMTGNERLMQELRDEPAFLPSWVLLPGGTGEVGALDRLIDSMIAAGVCIARVFPKDHNFSLSEWCSGALLSELESRRLPLMVDLGQTSYDEVNRVCIDHPDLPLIMSDVAYRSDRYIYPLLKANRNLRLETSKYQTHRGIESVCGQLGPERLIFGSGTPALLPGPMAMTVRYAKIPDSHREMILGGNLEQLMKGVRA